MCLISVLVVSCGCVLFGEVIEVDLYLMILELLDTSDPCGVTCLTSALPDFWEVFEFLITELTSAVVMLVSSSSKVWNLLEGLYCVDFDL